MPSKYLRTTDRAPQARIDLLQSLQCIAELKGEPDLFSSISFPAAAAELERRLGYPVPYTAMKRLYKGAGVEPLYHLKPKPEPEPEPEPEPAPVADPEIFQKLLDANERIAVRFVKLGENLAVDLARVAAIADSAYQASNRVFSISVGVQKRIESIDGRLSRLERIEQRLERIENVLNGLMAPVAPVSRILAVEDADG